MTDAQLIACALKEDMEAFNLLIGRWQDKIYNFIRRFVGDRDEAWDLSQQTFIKAYDRLGELREPDRFSAWVYQIATNSCRDALRKQKRQPTYSLDRMQEEADDMDALPELATAPTTHPDAMAQRRDLNDLLGRALQTLPEEQRLVAHLEAIRRRTIQTGGDR